jgi:predicted small metal-binding protein
MAGQERVVADCRLFPSEKNCSVTIAGSEEEVMRLALRHAIEEHGHPDSAELREQIHGMLAPEAAQARA